MHSLKAGVMTDYEPPDPSVAEAAYQREKESERQAQRLCNQSASVLKCVVRDTSESTLARATAFFTLMRRRDSELVEILLELFDDPDEVLWRSALRAWRPDDPRVRSRLTELLDDEAGGRWSTAAHALARLSDETLLPRWTRWLHDEDRPHRNVVIGCLRTLGTEAALAELRNILDQGDLEARQEMVRQLRGAARWQHAFTADGIHEARFWVERELERLTLAGTGDTT